jgi:mono/diheme cytochrome c family protein
LIWIVLAAAAWRYKGEMPLRRCALSLVLVGLGLAAHAQSPSRGELLYTTHCSACHDTKMHWRENKLATNWDTLQAQVRRWQGVAALNWSEGEIEDVARFLNQTIYRYPEPARVGLAMRPAAAGR